MAVRRAKVWIMGAAAALAAAYGAWLLAESFWAPAGCCGAAWPQPNPFQAIRLSIAKDPQLRDGALQRQTALTILAARPAYLDGWLRLAYADQRLHGRLTDEGRRALELSYSAAPFGGPLAIPRVLFVLDNWDEASLRTRLEVEREIDIIRRDPELRYRLSLRAPGLRNPQGRLIALLKGVWR